MTGAYGLGRGLATGDFNGDGKDDVLAGAQEPGAYWYLGSSTGILTTAANSLLTTDSPGVAAAARLNNDVYADAIVGDPGQAHVKVVYGAASAIGSTVTLTVPSSVRMGESVAGLGDVNGDGYDEVLAGDPAFSTNTGRAVIFWGSSTGVSSANRSIVAAPVTGSGFGATVFPAGDVNNDGLADFGVSDDYNNGKVYIFHGQAGGFNATPVNTLDVGDNNLGYSAAGGDDVNGDGFGDVLLGSIGNGVRVYHCCADLDSDGACAPADCADGDPNRKPGAPETCDGVDNDCDGNTDEGPLDDAPSAGQAGCWNGPGNCCSFGGLSWCPPPGASCSGNGTLLSPCSRGLLACSGGAWVCANVVAPSVEVCDFVDNNCDGSLDNVAGIGSACSVGVGACESPGITACGEGGVECLGNPGNPTVEVCNGLDDDCDEIPDDGFPDLGEPCYVGQGLCGNEGYRVCKADGTGTECDATPLSPEIEVCNFADDDCNGVEDDVLGVGVPCVVGTGICASPGMTECGEVGVYCAGEPGPSDEVETCNGLDDDCDGATDEDFSVGAPCDGLDEDNCPTGEVVCFEGGSTCLEVGQGGVELCDGLDNDCDEDVDEDFPEVGDECSVGVGACENFGEVQCTVSGTGTECSAVVGTPGAEVCNGFDDDCNEVVDDAPGVGDECVVGTGICAAPGVQVCGEGGLYCAGNPFPGLESEACNGLDDDCDGETDEGFGLGAPCDGPDIGSCAGGVIACAGPDETTCMGDQGGEIEYCNGVDDDCDEEVDETFLDLGQSCTVGTGACEAPGVRECHPNQQDTYCAGVEGVPSVEVCNGIDDDCDEGTDNVEGAVDECTVGTGVCAAPGVQVCGEGGLYCAGNPFPGLELEACNGLDDDCDGETDEDFAVGSPCDGDDSDTCALGVIACSNDVSVCDETAAVGVELCNGIDDDCDEDIDEDFTRLGESCTVGTGTCTAVGEWVCDVSGTGTTCDGTAGTPGTETCNGLDDDCDGETDDAPGVGDPCSVGVGACVSTGTQQCGEGGLECNAQPLPPPRARAATRSTTTATVTPTRATSSERRAMARTTTSATTARPSARPTEPARSAGPSPPLESSKHVMVQTTTATATPMKASSSARLARAARALV